jgi:hypothetical protein
MQKSFSALMEGVAVVGDRIDMTATLKKFPLKMVSVEDHARAVMIAA